MHVGALHFRKVHMRIFLAVRHVDTDVWLPSTTGASSKLSAIAIPVVLVVRV